MKFKVGDIVCMNPKYYHDVPMERGYITSETVEQFRCAPALHIIQWEDGRKGCTLLNPMRDYIILV